jgi:DNA-binding transcriptional LysR family regulator
VLGIITVVNILGIDLNLLYVLHQVLQELARLRALLHDPIVVRHARGLSPTPYALALRPQLDAAMNEVSKLFAVQAGFDPKTAGASSASPAPITAA